MVNAREYERDRKTGKYLWRCAECHSLWSTKFKANKCCFDNVSVLKGREFERI